MKKFNVPCDFNGTTSDFMIYVGEPKLDSHPLQFQANWLSKERGGTIPPAIMDSMEHLHKLSMENNVSFEELCVFAIEVANKKDKDGGAAAGDTADGTEESTATASDASEGAQDVTAEDVESEADAVNAEASSESEGLTSSGDESDGSGQDAKKHHKKKHHKKKHKKHDE